MKKLMSLAVALSVAGSASAASVGFEFGTNFYHPSFTGAATVNGQNFTVSWMLDNDLGLGFYTESDNTTGATSQVGLGVTAIQLSKGVVKNVNVGLNLGSGTPVGGTAATLVDIFGQVTILSGSGDKVNGSLVGTVGARFSRADLDSTATVSVADGYNLSLGVKIGF